MTDRSDLELVDMTLYQMPTPSWQIPGKGYVCYQTPVYKRESFWAIVLGLVWAIPVAYWFYS